MTIDFENYGDFYVTLIYDDGTGLDFVAPKPYTLKQCMSFIEYKMKQDPSVSYGVISNYDNGEVAVTVSK